MKTKSYLLFVSYIIAKFLVVIIWFGILMLFIHSEIDFVSLVGATIGYWIMELFAYLTGKERLFYSLEKEGGNLIIYYQDLFHANAKDTYPLDSIKETTFSKGGWVWFDSIFIVCPQFTDRYYFIKKEIDLVQVISNHQLENQK